ncbi:MAG: hypothetical protein JWP01_2416 [Myxococcales bacterium]|nr:hypothetical protein [Myxococcales bacterium]
MRAALMFLALSACTPDEPTPTQTVCPDPDPGTLTYESFGRQFMTDYCVQCHDSALPRSQRNGAPIYHDFETLLGVLAVPDHIDEQAGSGPAAENTFMPPDRCPEQAGGPLAVACKQPTAEERKQLAEWIACERARPHTF